jgi:hypothetical protein
MEKVHEGKHVMKWMRRAVMGALFVAAALQLGGCAGSYQARSVDLKESPLVNPDILKPGSDGQALYRYLNPKFDAKQYDKIMIDPVMIYKDGELDKEALENFQKLANNAYVYLTQELEKNYRIVKAPEPGALRIQWAIIDADSSKPVRNTLGTVFPIGMAVSVVRVAATGKQSGVGEITMQMKFTDAVTGELMGAALDRRVGGHNISTLWSSWNDADKALQYWSKQVVYALCGLRGGTNCVKPDSE